MRISDWSSDVCSSDLPAPVDAAPGAKTARTTDNGPPRAPSAFMRKSALIPSRCRRVKRCDVSVKLLSAVALSIACPSSLLFATWSARSEEHTSELQSLMRSSYHDFCLNKQK